MPPRTRTVASTRITTWLCLACTLACTFFASCEQSRIATTTNSSTIGSRLQPTPQAFALASKAPVILPTQLCGNLFLITVTVNGHDPFQMVLDSGATHTAVSKRIARALQGDVSAASIGVEGARGDSTTIDASLRVRSLVAGDLTLSDFDALVLDFSPFAGTLGERVQGILGYSAFKDLLLTLDYAQSQVRIENGSLKGLKDPNILSTLRPDAPIVRARIADRNIRVLLDSGLDGNVDLADVSDEDFQSPPVPVGNSHTIGGTALDYAGRLRHNLRIGNIDLTTPIVSRIAEDNLLGTEFLRRFVVTFDPSARLVRLTPTEPGAITFPPLRGIGVAFTQDRDFGSQISNVFPGSTAEATGLLPGDIPIRFNGKRRGEYRCVPGSQLLGTGDSIKLDIIRNRRERLSFDVPVGVLVP